MEPPPAGDPALPNRVGDYEPLQEIGRGGSGVVFRARRIRDNHLVALKMLLAGGFAGEQARERLRREAIVVSRLCHSNIVRVLEVGEQDGTPFMAMELVEGRDMAALLREDRPTPEKAAELVAVLAEAVAHAHARGILHRDIKPSNVIIDGKGQPHLTDFGLAKPLNCFDYLTLTGHAVGSAPYMAPEQAAGESTRLTPAADVYALGAVLYSLFAGQPPFVAGSALETLRFASDNEPVRPRRLNPSVPRGLETICLKCLEKTPTRRYGTARELAADLRSYLKGRPIVARPPSAFHRVSRALCRNPVAATLATLLSAAVVLVVLVFSEVLTLERLFQHHRSTIATQLSSVRQQRAANLALRAGQTTEAIQILARLVHDDPTNNTARARLFKNLSSLLPWPALPPMVHDGPVKYGEISSNRLWIVTASTDGWLHFWNATSAVHHARLPHDTERGRFSLSPDGTRVATLEPRGGLQVWQLPQASLEWQPKPGPGLPGRINSVEFSADGSLLIAADRGGMARIWRVQDWRELAALPHDAPLRAARLNAPGDRLLALKDNGLCLWNQQSNQWSILQSWDLEDPSVAEFSPTGSDFLFAAGETVYWADAFSGQVKQTKPFNGPVTHGCFSSDLRIAVIAVKGRYTFMWNAQQRARELRRRPNASVTSLRMFDTDLMLSTDTAGEAWLTSTKSRHEVMGRIRHQGPILDACFDGSRNRVLTVSEDRTARLSWVGCPARVETPLIVEGESSLFEFSASGKLVAVATTKGFTYIFDTRDPRLGRDVIRHASAVTSLAFHSSGDLLASADDGGRVILSDARTGKFREALDHQGPVQSLQSRSNLLAVLTKHGVTVWETLDGRPARLAFELAGALDFDFASDASHGVVGSVEGFQIFNCLTVPPQLRIRSKAEPAQMVRFSPDGNLILTFSPEQGARTWDANTGQFRGRLTSPGLEITSVAFSPDSQFVMLGAQNGLLTLCDLAHGNQLPNWARGSGAILSLDFSPDSSTVAFSDPGFVYLFDLNSTMPVLSGDEFRSNPRVRFSQSGGVLLILSGEFGAALHKVPSAPAPPPEIVLALAELQLLQRLDAKGNWKVLSPDEFRQRRKLLAERRWHLGPEPQVRIYR